MSGNWKQNFHSILNPTGNPILTKKKNNFETGPTLADVLGPLGWGSLASEEIDIYLKIIHLFF